MNRESTKKMTLIALAVVINYIGGQIALMLRLPIYLDSIGTILIGALLGPWCGLLPAFLSGILGGITTDIYAIYFMPVGMITGLVTGYVFKKGLLKRWKMPLGTAIITIPGTVLSASISAFLFGGATSSGSSFFVLFLRKIGLNTVASAFVIQIFTDYADRILSIALVLMVLAVVPKELQTVRKES